MFDSVVVVEQIVCELVSEMESIVNVSVSKTEVTTCVLISVTDSTMCVSFPVTELVSSTLLSAWVLVVSEESVASRDLVTVSVLMRL